MMDFIRQNGALEGELDMNTFVDVITDVLISK